MNRRAFFQKSLMGAAGLLAAASLPNLSKSLLNVAKRDIGTIFVTKFALTGHSTTHGKVTDVQTFAPIHLVAGDSLQMTWTFNGVELIPDGNAPRFVSKS